MTHPRGSQSHWRIFRAPLLIAVVSIIGLIAALVGDDGYDVVSWAALAVPLFTVYVSLRRARRA